MMPRKSDGCSFWPDGQYNACCRVHDRKYARGGTWFDRLEADVELARCVRKTSGQDLARLMYKAVRAFGWIFWWKHKLFPKTP